MNWSRYIKRTAVRRVVWVVVGLLVYAVLSALGVASNEAMAQSEPYCGQGGRTCDRAEAYASCQRQADAMIAQNPNRRRKYEGTCAEPSGTSTRYVCHLQQQYTSGGPWSSNLGCNVQLHPWVEECPGGGEWRDDLKRCFDPEECLNRNDHRRSDSVVETFTSGCVDGCELVPRLPYGCSSIIGDGTQLCAATYQYSGNSCTAPPPPEPPQEDPAERCVWAGGEAGAGGQHFCKKPDGRECYTIQGGNRAGQQICWQPGEAGRKVAGDTAQTRAPGPNEPPQPDPPPGESMEKVGDSVTTQTTTTNQSGSTTSTTTTRTDRTTYGTDAGGPGARDDSESGDGPGDDDGEGSYSGGGDCAAPPVCSGNAIQCGIALEVWNMRCEGAGEGDGDGEEGGVLADIDSAIAEGDADGDPDESEMFEHADPDTWREIRVVDAEGLDDSGFGFDRSCPQLPSVQVGPASLTFDLGPICTFLSWMSGLVLALSYFLAAKIIAGVK